MTHQDMGSPFTQGAAFFFCIVLTLTAWIVIAALVVATVLREDNKPCVVTRRRLNGP